MSVPDCRSCGRPLPDLEMAKIVAPICETCWLYELQSQVRAARTELGRASLQETADTVRADIAARKAERAHHD